VGASSIHFSLKLLSGCMCTLGINVIPEMGIDLDRLSKLPHNLLCLILSKIPFREVVQCYVLSKCCRFLYREIPNLDLSPYFMTPQYLHPPTLNLLSMETLKNIISNILQSHLSYLTVVRLINDTASWSSTVTNSMSWKFTTQSISNWLECLSRNNVEVIILKYYLPRESPTSEALFSYTHLTRLQIENYIVTRIPTQFIIFKHLLNCTFMCMELTDDSLSIFISQRPFLLKNLLTGLCWLARTHYFC